MPGPNDRPIHVGLDRTEAPSLPSSADETGAATGVSRAGAGSAFGPPVEPGEVGTLGPYRLVKELGRGGMGAVYAAIDTRLERRLALKLMLPEFAADPHARERFIREARAAAKISHDNVVTVHEADLRDGTPYIAMQYLEGYPLDEYLKKKGNPTPAQVVRIARETAAGLAAAHRLGLVHRDIKPANLWLEAPQGRVKVLDFGLARPVDAEAELTKQGAVVGTPAYMSPEQARGEKVDHRTDLFSLGALMYRLTTGRLPFQGASTMAVLIALGTEDPPPVRSLNPAVPEALADLIHQLLAKKADDRPKSADEVAARLRTIAQPAAGATTHTVGGSPQPQVVYVPIQVTAVPEANPFADLDATEVESIPEAAPVAEPRKPRARTLLVAAGLAALVAMLFGGVIIIIRNRDGSETKIEVPDGSTVTVKGKDGKTVAQVGQGGKTPALVMDADRKAAEWAIGLGGTVAVNGDSQYFTAAAALPREPFTLTWVSVAHKPVTDAGLTNLKDLKELAHLELSESLVTDVGLAHIRNVKSLKLLEVSNTAVTNAGLAVLRDCTGIVHLSLDKTGVGDAGLAHVAGYKELQYLVLSNTKVTDAGLVHLKNHPRLNHLDVSNTGVTDTGLVHLKFTPDLTNLDLTMTRVTDAGLVHVGTCRELVQLGLYVTDVTDAGLAHLKNCKELKSLNLLGTKVTGAGLAHLKNHPRLGILNLAQTQVTDDGLGHLAGMHDLTNLYLTETGVTDAGLTHLKGCRGLQIVDLKKTKVTAKGLADFHAAVPGCRIEHDGGVIEAIDVDRKAAEWVLSLGGLVQVNGNGAEPQLKAPADLPAGRFTLTAVDLGDRPGATDAGMAALRGCTGIVYLSLYHSPVGDAGLAHLEGMKSLKTLNLARSTVTDAGLARLEHLPGLANLDLCNTAVTDVGLARLKALPGLKDLHLSQTSVTDAGMAHLGACRNLFGLTMLGTKVADAGLAHLKDLKELRYLNLHDTAVTDGGLAHLKGMNLINLVLVGTKVTDAGLDHLKGLKDLSQLMVKQTAVTPAGAAAFHAAMPKCRVDHDGGVIEAIDVDRKLAEWVLSVGGKVWLNGIGPDVTAATGLPKDPFRLTNVNLDRVNSVTDADLARFRGLRHLQYFGVEGSTGVTDVGLTNLVVSRGLGSLNAQATRVTAKGAADFHAAVPGCRFVYDGGVIEAKN